MNPVISVVTGTYNRLPLLQKFIESCRVSVPIGIAIDFVIVDGGSTDGTQEWLRTQHDVSLIEHGELLGAIKAFDDGAYAARGKYVLMANDDIEVLGDSLTRAIMHLEENPTCGGVCFYDDRPNPWVQGLHVWQQPAIKGGANITVNYAQVGLFRKWLGERVGWWGSRDETFTAKTYAGDNLLSSRIWELGYTLDKLDGVVIHDLVHEDELRAINRGDPSTFDGGMHPDSAAYYKLYPNGPTIPPAPTVDNPDKMALRILYLPIYEQDRLPDGSYTPRCQNQHEQKCGLRKALQRRGYLVYEVDYLAYHQQKDRLYGGLMQVLELFQPHVILTQIHGTDVLNADIMAQIRAKCPRVMLINWNGDVYPAALKSQPMLDLLRYVDLQLVVNAGVIPWYEQHGIACAYWQCAAEEPDGALPKVNPHDVLFLGSNYSEYRRAFGDFLLSLGVDVGMYGLNWGNDGYPDCTYDFLTGRALYKNAKIALGENQYLENTAFVSNRLWEALDAGGALLLHQHVRELEQYTGLIEGTHYIGWQDYNELGEKIRYWLDPANEKARKKIVKAAQKFVRENHSFDARMRELFIGTTDKPALILKSGRKLAKLIALQYLGRPGGAGGIHGPVTKKNYVHEDGKPLVVDVLDAPEILRLYPGLFAEMGAATNDRVNLAVEGLRNGNQ